MNRELADRTDYESEEYHKLIDRFTHENDRFLMMGGTNFRAEIERTLLGLGFRREDFDRPTSEFSGGWLMRIELAKLLLRRPDVLLLDEPTNHLDIESIQWLENFLFIHLNAVYLFQLLDTTLHLHRLCCLVTETLDEILRILYLFLLIFIGTKLLFAALFTKHNELIIFHFIIVYLPALRWMKRIIRPCV